MNENDLSYLIRGSIFRISKTLGPGLFEKAYVAALEYELLTSGLHVLKQVPVPVKYKSQSLDVGFKIDLLVNKKVVVEVKSIDKLENVHHKQLISYLKLTGIKLGLLVNFNVNDIAQGIFRKVNGL